MLCSFWKDMLSSHDPSENQFWFRLPRSGKSPCLADRGKAWWLLCQPSPDETMATQTLLRESSPAQENISWFWFWFGSCKRSQVPNNPAQGNIQLIYKWFIYCIWLIMCYLPPNDSKHFMKGKELQSHHPIPLIKVDASEISLWKRSSFDRKSRVSIT